MSLESEANEKWFEWIRRKHTGPDPKSQVNQILAKCRSEFEQVGPGITETQRKAIYQNAITSVYASAVASWQLDSKLPCYA